MYWSSPQLAVPLLTSVMPRKPVHFSGTSFYFPLIFLGKSHLSGYSMLVPESLNMAGEEQITMPWAHFKFTTQTSDVISGLLSNPTGSYESIYTFLLLLDTTNILYLFSISETLSCLFADAHYFAFHVHLGKKSYQNRAWPSFFQQTIANILCHLVC